MGRERLGSDPALLRPRSAGNLAEMSALANTSLSATVSESELSGTEAMESFSSGSLIRENSNQSEKMSCCIC